MRNALFHARDHTGISNRPLSEFNVNQVFSPAELKARALRRIAIVLQEHAEEGRAPHSRIFETLMPDPWIYVGVSRNGPGWREHIVPCAYLARECMREFREGRTLDEVSVLLDRYLGVAHISREERMHLDFKLGYRNSMPPSWVFGIGHPLQRLIEAGITIEAPPSGHIG
jgi:hypothetical protein